MSQYFDEDPTAASDPRDVVWSLRDGPLTHVTYHCLFG